MEIIARASTLAGSVRIPASKSHTVRAAIIGALAAGDSVIRRPLDSLDTRSAVVAGRALGAAFDLDDPGAWRVRGTGGRVATPAAPVDIGNSGTTLYLALTAAALGAGPTVLTGDEQIRSRPARALADALNALGARVSCRGANGCPPVEVRGPLQGGRAALHCPTSQYLSSLLIGLPLAGGDSELEILSLNERPYVRMTLDWLDRAGIRYQAEGLERFRLPGGQAYPAFDRAMPGDFSTAAFFLVAAAVTGSTVTLEGLDPGDSQGDKAVLEMLAAMGCRVEQGPAGVTIGGGELKAGEFDLNATPDALPAMAVAGAFARGATRLVNVPQARLKETDRIKVMAAELARLGIRTEELADGLVVEGGRPGGGVIDGRGDHRVVMAFAAAGLAAAGEVRVTTAESAAVTVPDFVPLMRRLGADLEARD